MGRPYAEVIGDPIAHSKSPLIHNFWLGKLGIDAEYRACHVRPDELADYFTRRRGDAEWRGCNVTIPHKVAVLQLIDSADPAALNIGAVNTVIQTDEDALLGFNTDAQGFMEPLIGHLSGVERTGTWAFILGSGGAARAAAFALWHFDCRLYFVARNRDAARAIADDIAAARSSEIGTMSFEQFQALVLDHPGDWQGDAPLIVVNASSLGMTGQARLLLDFARLTAPAIAYDVVYAPLTTEFLSQAEMIGLPTIDGLQMLVGQAAVAFEKFFGQPAPREYDAELRAQLTA